MKHCALLSVSIALFLSAAASTASAGELALGNGLSLGGAARMSSGRIDTPTRLEVVPVGPLEVGTLSGSEMQVGGYVGWRQGGYRFGLDLSPASLGGGGFAGLDLSNVAAADETRYSLRLGTVWADGLFSLNAANSLGVTNPDTGGVSMTVSIDHALTPSMRLSGRVEAMQPSGNATDTQTHYVLGAGLGVRF